MLYKKKYITSSLILSVLSFFHITLCKAQDTTFIYSGNAVHIFSKDTVTFFGTIINEGKVELTDKSYILFFGNSWKHRGTGEIQLTDQSANAAVEFRSPHPFTGASDRQWLDQYYNSAKMIGTGFSTILINNKSGVGLLSDCMIGKQLILKKGHLFLNRQTLVIGSNNETGKIDGYSENSFIVTGQEKGNGFLLRKNLPINESSVFPIGESDQAISYHPLAIRPHNCIEDVGVSVFSGTWSLGNNGTLIQDSSINMTWILKKTSSVKNIFSLSLQHNMNDESSLFQQYKSRTYVGIFNEGEWKNISFKHSIPEMPGKITSGDPILTAAVNHATKELTSVNDFYISKFVSTTHSSLFISIPNVFTPNGDGKNDRFEIAGIDAYPDNDFTVFNRWGHEVYKIKGYSSAKQFAGEGLSEGTYFYQLRIKVTNSVIPIMYKGYLTIIR